MTCLKTNHLLDLKLKCAEKGKHKESVDGLNAILKEATSRYENASFINPVKAICLDELCKYSANGKAIFMTDGEHLSGYGSEVIWGYIMNQINEDNFDKNLNINTEFNSTRKPTCSLNARRIFEL